MVEWVKACEDALGQALGLNIESPELLEALTHKDPDEALTALAPLLLMLEGARRVVVVRSALLVDDVTAARNAAQKAFELAVLAAGGQPEDPNMVCSVD